MSLENDYLGGSDPVYPEDGQSETSTAPNTMALRNDHEVPDYMYSATELLQADLRLWTPIYGQRHFSAHSNTLTAPNTTADPGLPSITARPCTTQDDWEAQKHLIRFLYLDQNLNLQDLIKIMESRHQFRATPKMYKTQFTKWNWRKYRSTRTPVRTAGPRARAKSCLRRPDLRQKALLNANDGTALVNRALSASRDILWESIKNDPEWSNPSSLKFRLANFSIQVGIYIHAALQNFRTGNTGFAGPLLRRSFLEVEYVLRNEPDLSDLVLFAMTELEDSAYVEIRTTYLAFLANCSLQMFPRHPVTQIATSLHSLLLFEPWRVSQYLSAAWELWRDAHIRFIADKRNTNYAWLTYACAVNQAYLLGASTEDAKQILYQKVAKYKEYPEEAETSEKPEEAKSFSISGEKDTFFVIQDFLGFYLDDFVPRLEWINAALCDRNAHLDNFRDWETTDQLSYLTCLRRIMSFYLNKGDPVSALTHSSTAIEIFEANPRLADFKLSCIDEFEDSLRKRGFDEQASEFRDLYQRSPVMVEDLALVKRLEEIDLAI